MIANGQPAKPRVLVVDDERVIADTLAIILNQNGFEASAVYTGTAAVDRARDTRPDLIISDVIMPDMNGIDAAIHYRISAKPGDATAWQDVQIFIPSPASRVTKARRSTG